MKTRSATATSPFTAIRAAEDAKEAKRFIKQVDALLTHSPSKEDYSMRDGLELNWRQRVRLRALQSAYCKKDSLIKAEEGQSMCNCRRQRQTPKFTAILIISSVWAVVFSLGVYLIKYMFVQK